MNNSKKKFYNNIMPQILPKVKGRICGIYNFLEVIFMKYERIRNLREDKDWTQQNIADMLFINRRTYAAYENGINSMTPETLCKIADIYGTSVDYLLGRTDSFVPYPKKK